MQKARNWIENLSEQLEFVSEAWGGTYILSTTLYWVIWKSLGDSCENESSCDDESWFGSNFQCCFACGCLIAVKLEFVGKVFTLKYSLSCEEVGRKKIQKLWDSCAWVVENQQWQAVLFRLAHFRERQQHFTISPPHLTTAFSLWVQKIAVINRIMRELCWLTNFRSLCVCYILSAERPLYSRSPAIVDNPYIPNHPVRFSYSVI